MWLWWKNKTLLDGLEQHPVELLNILLQKSIFLLPLKRFYEVGCRCRQAHFEPTKQFLQLIEYTIFSSRVDFLTVYPRINAVPELWSHEERLYETIDVTSGTHVGQSFVAHLNYYAQQAAQEKGADPHHRKRTIIRVSCPRRGRTRGTGNRSYSSHASQRGTFCNLYRHTWAR